jgi:hypothetical protein
MPTRAPSNSSSRPSAITPEQCIVQTITNLENALSNLCASQTQDHALIAEVTAELARQRDYLAQLQRLMPPETDTPTVPSFQLSPAALHQFWSHVDKTDSCWLWIGPLSNNAGWFDHPEVPFTQRSAYRIAYALEHGPIPPLFVLRHRCAQRPCVNLAHLLPGEQWENALDIVIRKLRNQQPGQLYTYEDDIETSLAILQARLQKATTIRRIDRIQSQIATALEKKAAKETKRT